MSSKRQVKIFRQQSVRFGVHAWLRLDEQFVVLDAILPVRECPAKCQQDTFGRDAGQRTHDGPPAPDKVPGRQPSR